MELEEFKFLFTNSGKEGIELAGEFASDLVICDVLMCDMDGYEVLRLLLDNSKTYEIRFIFSTSHSEKVNKTKALELGADDYIIKPFELETLLEMSKSWIKSGSNRIKHLTT
ncbi:MAG: response regulator [Cyclobacteriaceae bacterium]|nr:response regulator [Cyclobacteriaceae bacterium]